ncbi:MAG TPA: ABC transporter substrate-binding protein [Spirochaetota bacterium]|nr:ABC transporter substrate-binding protein [Spirochaetota bacterium]
MSLKKFFVILMCVALVPLCVSCKKQRGETIKIGAIFAVTGPASFLGAPEEKTARMMVDEINSNGGINGKNLELVVKDSAGSPEKAISFAKQLIEEEKVFAIIGPSTSGETMKIKSICEEGKTILISCAAAEVITNPVAKYIFKVAQNDSFGAQKICEVMKKKGINRIGMVSSNDGYGIAGKEQMEKAAARNGIAVVISEVYDKKATDLTGVLTKLKAKNVQAVVNWSIVPAQSIVAKNMKQLNMGVQLFQSSGFGNIKYAKEAGEAGEGIIFPCGRLLIAESLPDDHPQKAVLMKYKKDFESKFGEDASTFGGHAYDAVIILAEAIKKGGGDREKVRDAIEGLKGFAGIGGIYNFSPQDHLGLDINAFDMLTVKGGRFVRYEDK